MTKYKRVSIFLLFMLIATSIFHVVIETRLSKEIKYLQADLACAREGKNLEAFGDECWALVSVSETVLISGVDLAKGEEATFQCMGKNPCEKVTNNK